MCVFCCNRVLRCFLRCSDRVKQIQTEANAIGAVDGQEEEHGAGGGLDAPEGAAVGGVDEMDADSDVADEGDGGGDDDDDGDSEGEEDEMEEDKLREMLAGGRGKVTARGRVGGAVCVLRSQPR